MLKTERGCYKTGEESAGYGINWETKIEYELCEKGQVYQ